MPVCPSCGVSAPLGSGFCSRCGTSLRASDAEVTRTGLADTPFPSGGSLDGGQFVPGTLLMAGRYRIVGLLGRGGMGEVYRAEDLKLGQTVALKFLPASVEANPGRLARLLHEARVARQVSHRNVCRVYDIDEVDGRHFISMEFVDGEDLSSLLRRIGRLPRDKAVEIAREICFGLAAVHEQGLVHRDLKPANVMVDGRGRVRLTDFGLASLAGADGEDGRSGTPAYMAPEQLERGEVGVRSDVYALGLVLYELFTGKPAFQPLSFEEARRLHRETPPTDPSQVADDVDPIVERVLLRCLAKDPMARPGSALAVSAALPGGDPVAAALSAGETPSPEMVAASGGEGSLSPRAAMAFAGVAVTCIVAILLLAQRGSDLAVSAPIKPRAVLVDRAQDVLRRSGYVNPPADHAAWFARNYEFLKSRASSIPGPERVRGLAAAPWSTWRLCYRQSPRPMVPGPTQALDFDSPPLDVTGMAALELDGDGRLLSLRAIPPEVERGEPRPAPDWSALLQAAGLDPARTRPAAPRWLPTVGFDARAGWDGAYEGHPDLSVHVSAASYRGRPVYFQVVTPWMFSPRDREAPQPLTRTVSQIAFAAALVVTLGVAVWLVRRNLREARVDRRGARRLSAAVFAVVATSILLGSHLPPDVLSLLSVVAGAATGGLLSASLVWVAYVALEPTLRRRLPHVLVSWTRLLAGRWSDPAVGRDLVVGAAAGSLVSLLAWLVNSAAWWIDVPGQTTIPPAPLALGTPREVVAVLLQVTVGGPLFLAFGMTLMLLILLVLLRRPWAAAVLTAVVSMLINLGGENVLFETAAIAINSALVVTVLMRFGFLALLATQAAASLLTRFPMTLDTSRWWFGASLLSLALLAAMIAFGVRRSARGRLVWREAL